MYPPGARQSNVIDIFNYFVDVNEKKGRKAVKTAAEKQLNGQYNGFITHCLFLEKWEAKKCVKLSDRLGTFSERSAIGQGIRAIKLRHFALNQTVENPAPSVESGPLYHQEGAWVFESKRPDTSYGHLYTFRMQTTHLKAEQDQLNSFQNHEYVRNPDYQQLIKKRNEAQFPAVEIDTLDLSTFQGRIGKDILSALGYSFGNVESEELLITVPDKRALEVRWALLQEIRPDLNLPDLRIIESTGIASDLDFARAYRRGIVLAEGPEFIHDHVHILAKIARCVQSSHLEKQMNATFDRIIGSWIELIKTLKAKKDESNAETIQQQTDLLELFLGVFVDNASSAQSFGSPCFFERDSFVNAVKAIIRHQGEVPPENIDLEAYGFNPSKLQTFDEFLDLQLDRKIIDYVRKSSGFSISWEKRFGCPLSDDHIEQVVSLLEMNRPAVISV